MSKPRTQAEILRAAELFQKAFKSRSALEDRSTIRRVAAAITNYLILQWAAGEDNSVVELLATMERIEFARAAKGEPL